MAELRNKVRTLSQHIQNTEEYNRQPTYSLTILENSQSSLVTSTNRHTCPQQPTIFLEALPEELSAMPPEAVPEVMLDVEEASEDDTSGDTVQEPEEREKDLQKT